MLWSPLYNSRHVGGGVPLAGRVMPPDPDKDGSGVKYQGHFPLRSPVNFYLPDSRGRGLGGGGGAAAGLCAIYASAGLLTGCAFCSAWKSRWRGFLPVAVLLGRTSNARGRRCGSAPPFPLHLRCGLRYFWLNIVPM